jgi:hypothetical protein
LIPLNKISCSFFFLFNRFEEIGTSIDQIEEDGDEGAETPSSNGIIRSTRKKKTHKEHVI